MATRKAIGQKARFEVFKRDGFKCSYCGRGPQEVLLVLDHIVPVASGGINDPTNLTTACFDCNAGKGDRTLTTAPVAVDIQKKAEELEERAAQIRAMAAAYSTYTKAKDELQVALCAAWEERFQSRYHDCRALLMFSKWFSYDQLLEAMDITLAAYNVQIRFKYFCGIIKRWRANGVGNFEPQESASGDS